MASQHAACHLFASTSTPGAFSGDGIAVDDGYTGNVDGTTGPAVNVEGGWHDAGDYIKFVGTTSFTLAVDLLALRDHPAAFAGARTGAAKDALRAEMRWGLDWLVKMLGGAQMYHQVSGAPDHDVGWRVPEADTMTPVTGYSQRPVFRFAQGAGGNLLGRSAAALALGSQVFSDDAMYSAQLLALAKTVYAAGVPLTMAQSPDPASFYQEDTVDDDLAFGAAILAQVTGTSSYASDAFMRAQSLEGPPTGVEPLYWGDVTSLAFLETGLAFPAGSAERTEMAQALATLAAPVLATPSGPGAAFGYAMTVFNDDSLEQALGAASVCLAAARFGGSSACAEIARTQLHWLFGQNPFGLSFMVGDGCAYPVNIHHSLAQAAQVVPIGAVLGGPTSLATLMGLGDPNLPIPDGTTPNARWSTDGLLYEDLTDNYVFNEPAIDFTAPLVFIMGELLDGH
jgi:endoglucanase